MRKPDSPSNFLIFFSRCRQLMKTVSQLQDFLSKSSELGGLQNLHEVVSDAKQTAADGNSAMEDDSAVDLDMNILVKEMEKALDFDSGTSDEGSSFYGDYGMDPPEGHSQSCQTKRFLPGNFIRTAIDTGRADLGLASHHNYVQARDRMEFENMRFEIYLSNPL